jgi:hypothetical protein
MHNCRLENVIAGPDSLACSMFMVEVKSDDKASDIFTV